MGTERKRRRKRKKKKKERVAGGFYPKDAPSGMNNRSGGAHLYRGREPGVDKEMPGRPGKEGGKNGREFLYYPAGIFTTCNRRIKKKGTKPLLARWATEEEERELG